MTQFDTEGVSDEMLMALADGELGQPEADALRARIAREPALAARYAVFTETAEALRAAFVQPEIPAHLIEAVERAQTGRTAAHTGTVLPFRQRALVWPTALAASLAIGLGLGWVLNGSGGAPAAPGLQDVAKAVSNSLTGDAVQVAGKGEARVLGSFETDKGLCRLVALQPDAGGASRFVTCRTDADWVIALSVTDDAGNGFAPASATGTEMIDLFLDSVQAGPALGPDAEAQELR